MARSLIRCDRCDLLCVFIHNDEDGIVRCDLNSVVFIGSIVSGAMTEMVRSLIRCARCDFLCFLINNDQNGIVRCDFKSFVFMGSISLCF